MITLPSSFMRTLVALSVLAAVLTSSIRVRPASLDAPVGSISLNGSVQVNGQAATSGQTIFSKNTIVTSPGSESSVELTNSVRLRVSEQTTLTTESSATHVSVALPQGQLHCLTPPGVLFDLNTSDASLSVLPGESTAFSVITTECAGTTISVESGHLDVRVGGGARTLIAGETVSTSSTAPAFNPRKRIGLFILIGMAVSVLLVAVAGSKPEQEAPSPGGCVDIGSGEPSCH